MGTVQPGFRNSYTHTQPHSFAHAVSNAYGDPGPTPLLLTQSDVTCDGGRPDENDALQLLHFLAALQAFRAAGCPAMNASTGALIWGDLDCSGDVAVGDLMMLLRYLAHALASQPRICPAIGGPFP